MNAQNIGGYFCDKNTGTMTVFINYIKEDGSIVYEEFSELVAMNKPRRWNEYDGSRSHQ